MEHLESPEIPTKTILFVVAPEEDNNFVFSFFRRGTAKPTQDPIPTKDAATLRGSETFTTAQERIGHKLAHFVDAVCNSIYQRECETFPLTMSPAEEVEVFAGSEVTVEV